MAYLRSSGLEVPFVVSTYSPATLIVGHDADVRALFTVLDRTVWVAMTARRMTVRAHEGAGRIEVATDGCPLTAAACDTRPLLTPTGLPIAPAPKPGVVLGTGPGLTHGGIGLHLSTGAALPGRYEFDLTIRYPANPLAPAVLNATAALRVRLDLATPIPAQNAPCTPADLHRRRPPIPTAHALEETVAVLHGEVRLDPPASSLRPPITAAHAARLFAADQVPNGGGTEILVLASLSETFPRTIGANGLTKAEINNELAWVLYTHHVAVPPITGPSIVATNSTSVAQPPCDFLDGLDAVDARTGKPLGSSGFTREADPIEF